MHNVEEMGTRSRTGHVRVTTRRFSWWTREWIIHRWSVCVGPGWRWWKTEFAFKVRSVREKSERASGQRAISRLAETKTDGEFTPALCAWIIHAPPGLSPGEPRLSYYRAYRLRPAERATWGRKIREKRRTKKGRLSKAKRRARLTKRMDRRRVPPPLKPVLILLATLTARTYSCFDPVITWCYWCCLAKMENDHEDILSWCSSIS